MNQSECELELHSTDVVHNIAYLSQLL